MDPSNWQTYLVTQASRSAGRETTDIVEQAIEGGIDAVQLREKHTTARERYKLGIELRELTAEADVPLLVNDRVDIARAVDADGVHLGQSDVPIGVARKLLGPDTVIGCSASTVVDARQAAADGADYLGVGAVYPTDSKQDIDDEEFAIGTDRIRAVADAVPIPVIGIGGITVDNASDVVAHGAAGVAVISEITAANDPQTATTELGKAVSNVEVTADE